MSAISANHPIKTENKDILKDTPLRAVGYLDDIGAAARPLVKGAKSGLLKSFPSVAYIPATVYMTACVADKFHKGADGTGKKPSVKAGAREALYQATVNVLAPMAIVSGISKAAKALPSLADKLPDTVKAHGKNILTALSKNKTGANLIKNSGKFANAATFGLSILALAKLSKPIDKTVEKVFEKTLDPILKTNKSAKKSEE